MRRLGVIFDMDGVLVDSYRAHLESWQRAAGDYELSMTEEDFARTFGRTSREIIRQLWPGRFNDKQIGEFDGKKEAAYRDILRRQFPEMSGASELIESLHAAGFAMAIGSSGPMENVELTRKSLRAGEFIQAAVHGGEVKHGKPDPEVFLIAAGKLGLDPASCAVVEDAPVGLHAARRAGMAAIALTGTADRKALEAHAHRTVDHLSELSPQTVAEVIRLARE
jgi:beta-phosphoglucomutase